jgi:uncharacterized protein
MHKWIMFSLLLLGTGCATVDESTVEFPNGATVTVDIADDLFERTQGLSGRESLESNEGLLFLHEEHAVQRYWMKDMLIPIDIIWIDGEEVVGFVEAAQPEKPPLTIYESPVPVDKVLEVSSGFVTQNSVNIGDILDIQVATE